MSERYHSCHDGLPMPGRAGTCPRCKSARRSPTSARSRRPARRWATAVLRRDPVCRVCEDAPSTEVHHIRAVADGGHDTMANGLGTCDTCHALAKGRSATLRELQAVARIRGILPYPRCDTT